jgi:hypothetical protein
MTIQKKRGGGCDKPSQKTTENKSYKSNNKKRSNKDLCCPFVCPNCQSLGGNLVKTRYEVINILSDTNESIFSPMHEKYHDDEVNSIRNTGQVFLSADFVDSLFQNFKK